MKFSELATLLQNSIARRFNLPQDTSEVFVDEYNRPYIKDNGMMMISVKKSAIVGEGFHTHGAKNN